MAVDSSTARVSSTIGLGREQREGGRRLRWPVVHRRPDDEALGQAGEDDEAAAERHQPQPLAQQERGAADRPGQHRQRDARLRLARQRRAGEEGGAQRRDQAEAEHHQVEHDGGRQPGLAAGERAGARLRRQP